MQNNVLDWIGKLFVYRSPPPLAGERLERYKLMGMSNSKLRPLVPTPSHYSKRQLVDMILARKNK